MMEGLEKEEEEKEEERGEKEGPEEAPPIKRPITAASKKPPRQRRKERERREEVGNSWSSSCHWPTAITVVRFSSCAILASRRGGGWRRKQAGRGCWKCLGRRTELYSMPLREMILET